MMRSSALLFVLVLATSAFGASQPADLLAGGHRDAMKAGWIPVHLEGSPEAIGYQHGYLLAEEIQDNYRAIALELTHDRHKSWTQLRELSDRLFVPKLSEEYRTELGSMAAGVQAKGVRLDLTDLVTMNAYMEFSYYDDARKAKAKNRKAVSHAPDHCSAFVATGSYTHDGRVVIGHNNWSDYLTGTRWNVIFDVAPASGHRFLMDGMPGLIHSGDDFGINDGGILITETTISGFVGFDSNGVPEFVRARKAMQYASSIDEFVSIMKDGNNGGYANTWLVADRKTGEIARLELGLKHMTLKRTTDGYFVGSNFPIDPQLIAEETSSGHTTTNDPDQVRHRRWDQLMTENKGKIDVEAGKRFETDHYDVTTKEIDPNERTICGHVDKSRRGLPGWQGPYAPAGVAEVKVADSTMAEKMSFVAGAGHPCGIEFHAAEALAAHKEYRWQKELLHDVKANPFVVMEAAAPTRPVPATQ